jgi:hypothetical protein
MIPRTTMPIPMKEEKCVEPSKALAGMVVALIEEGPSLTKKGERSNPNLETTKPRPISATHVLNHARKVL